MPIQVTCPSCLSRFTVSDKFAGKKGPCPKCKKQIAVPEKTDEIVIHAPRDDAPKDSKGQSVLKPIQRTETRVTGRAVAITVGTIVVMLAAAAATRLWDPVPWWWVALGAIVLAPPAIYAAYGFARDAELAPLVGSELRNRLLILSAIFPALWLIYAFVPMYVLELRQPSDMSLFVAGIMLVIVAGIGAFAAANALELEFSGGLAVAGLYLVGALILALIAGVPVASLNGSSAPAERELLFETPPGGPASGAPQPPAGTPSAANPSSANRGAGR